MIKLSYFENYRVSQDESNCTRVISEIIEEVNNSMEYLRKNRLIGEEASYLNLFVDVLKNLYVAGDDIKILFIQR